MNLRHILVPAPVAMVAVLAGCGLIQPVPTPQDRQPAPAGDSAEVAYLTHHPVTPSRGMKAGILIRMWLTSDGIDCHTWHGTVVILTRRGAGKVENLGSYECNDGMNTAAAPGDLVEFPATGYVSAPADNDPSTSPARVLVQGAVPR